MWFLVILVGINFDFGEFEPFFKSQIYQNLKLRVSEIVKMAIFEIKLLPELILRKIECQINSWVVDLNFTFWKFLENRADFLHKTRKIWFFQIWIFCEGMYSFNHCISWVTVKYGTFVTAKTWIRRCLNLNQVTR